VSRALYRIAAALIVLLDLGHSAGYPWSDPAWGVDLHAIQSSHFNVLGSSRTYWNFYVGFGLSVSVFLLLPAITAWQLGNASTQDPQRRITAWVLSLSFAAITLLDCMFFFIIPIVLSAAITLCLITATLLAPPGAAHSMQPSRGGGGR
jgi:hypothetical protein